MKEKTIRSTDRQVKKPACANNVVFPASPGDEKVHETPGYDMNTPSLAFVVVKPTTNFTVIPSSDATNYDDERNSNKWLSQMAQELDGSWQATSSTAGLRPRL